MEAKPKRGAKAPKPETGLSAPVAVVDVAEKAKRWPAMHTPRLRRIGELRAYERNARTHTAEQIDQVARSIQEWGWTMPVLVTPDDQIIAGHCRVKAAERLGFNAVPCLTADGWSPEQIRAYILADNKLAENAGWDTQLLAEEYAALEDMGFAVDLIGFSDAELREIRPASEVYNTDPDETPEPGQAPISKPGDVWALGDHRLMCGDATVSGDVETLMGGDFADAVWTDPPYNVEISKWDREGIAGDKQCSEDFDAFLGSAFANVFAATREGCACYVAHADTAGDGLAFRVAFAAAGFKLQGVLVWVKNTFVVGRSDYHWQHEPVLYGWKPGAAHRWFGDRKKTTIVELDNSTVFGRNSDGSISVRVAEQFMRLALSDKAQKALALAGLGRLEDVLEAQVVEPTVLEYDRPRKSDAHPTMKPVEFIARMLRNSTMAGDLVLDPFGGSGSTLICAEMLDLRARLLELDARYCDVIVKRWQDFTGKAATLDGDGRTFGEVATARTRGKASA